MKLRNKKTGEIVEWLTLELVDVNEIEFNYVNMSGHEQAWNYSSLEKFNEEWEDYEPAEPLIKDEKCGEGGKNKEIKFRAWDKTHKKYIIPQRLALDDDGALDFCVYNGGGYALECFVVEQYTGLKDKNGKEIYEGDIVQTLIRGVWTTGNSDAIFGEKMWKLVVFWADAECGFLFKVIGSKNQPNRVYDILDQHLGAFEVIGNIHENPELLEGK